MLPPLPQIRYPDCYGIDMSELGKFIAFQAAVALIQEGDIMDYWMRWQKNAGKPSKGQTAQTFGKSCEESLRKLHSR